MPTRKNVNSLSQAKINTYVKGVKAMKKNGTYDKFIESHFQIWRDVHFTPMFLPWHRAFLMDFEQKLRDAISDSSFALPYWDWTEVNPTVFLSNIQFDPIWSPSVMGGAGNPVATGPFATSEWLTISPDNQFGISLVRNLSSPPTDFVYTTRKTVHQLFTNVHYDDFRVALESGPHADMHMWVGGQMGTIPNSVNDPVFWLHHANLDRIWAQWQQIYPTSPITAPNSVTSPNFGPTTRMPPTFDGTGERAVNTVLNVVGQQYDYDTYYDVKKLEIIIRTGKGWLAGTDSPIECQIQLERSGALNAIRFWNGILAGPTKNKDAFERGQTDHFVFDNPVFTGGYTNSAITTPVMFRTMILQLQDIMSFAIGWDISSFEIIADGATFSSGSIDVTLDEENPAEHWPLAAPTF